MEITECWILFTRAENPVEVDFDSETTVLWGRHLVCFMWQWTCSFCHDSEELPGESQHDGDQPPILFIWLMLADIFHFLQWKWPPREIFQNMKDIKNITNHRITHHFFICVWRLFFASVERCRLLRKIILKENKSFRLISCVCVLIDWSCNLIFFFALCLLFRTTLYNIMFLAPQLESRLISDQCCLAIHNLWVLTFLQCPFFWDMALHHWIFGFLQFETG